jgi:hypothetical protein
MFTEFNNIEMQQSKVWLTKAQYFSFLFALGVLFSYESHF